MAARPTADRSSCSRTGRAATASFSAWRRTEPRSCSCWTLRGRSSGSCLPRQLRRGDLGSGQPSVVRRQSEAEQCVEVTLHRRLRPVLTWKGNQFTVLDTETQSHEVRGEVHLVPARRLAERSANANPMVVTSTAARSGAPRSSARADPGLRNLQEPRSFSDLTIQSFGSARTGVSAFVTALLDCNREGARETLRHVTARYPIVVTRDLTTGCVLTRAARSSTARWHRHKPCA